MPWNSKYYFRRTKTAGCARRWNHYIRSVWGCFDAQSTIFVNRKYLAVRVAQTSVFVVFGDSWALKPLRVQCQTFLSNRSHAKSICFVKRNRPPQKQTCRIICRLIWHYKTSTSGARAVHKMIKKTFGSTHVMVLAHPQNTQHEKHCKYRALSVL